jgi:endonuclease/exonuclease/phosphatase family metal-dependent hydrolase
MNRSLPARTSAPSLAFALAAIAALASAPARSAAQDAPPAAAPPPSRGFAEAFDADPGDGWRWVRESPGGWRVRDGALELRAQKGRVWSGNDATNILVLDRPADGLATSVDVDLGKPESKWEQGGLLAYRSDDAFVKLVVEHIDGKFFVVLAREADGANCVFAQIEIPGPSARLRLELRGESAHASYRLAPEADWQDAGDCPLDGAAGGSFALFTQDGSDSEVRWVRFDNLEVGRAGPAPTATGVGPNHLRVATYNIRHGAGMSTDTVDLSRAAAVLEKLGADLVALQEIDNRCTRSGGIDQAADLAGRLGMHDAFGAFMDFQGGAYGLAVLSRFPVLEHHVHRLPDGAEPRVALEVVVDVPGLGQTSFVSLHFDWTDDAIRGRQSTALVEALATRDRPVVLAGDFNAGREAASMRPFASEPWANLPKAGAAATFPADRPRVEIDHIVTRGMALPAGATCQVADETSASDHRPVVAVLEIPSRG